MPPAFWIDRDTGSIRIGEIALLCADQRKIEVASLVGALVSGARDHGNGYAWLSLGGLTFGGQPTHLSLCFRESLLESASWGVQLPNVSTENGWPTRGAIDAEIAFVRRILAGEMGIHPGRLTWGDVWSTFDAKAYIAASGLRYHRTEDPMARR